MRHRSGFVPRPVFWLGFSSLLGCNGDKPGDDSVATGPGPSPCTDGSWGAIPDPETAIHVATDGDDSADGSIAAPLATLDAALSLARTRTSDKSIFVGPGTYDGVALSIAQDPGDGSTDDGLLLQGCAEETTLNAADEDGPILRVTEAQDIILAGLDLVGGSRSLWIWSGADVKTSRISIKGSQRLGIIIDGHDTVVDLEDILVDGTEDDTDHPGLGFGIGISKGTVTGRRIKVNSSRSAGIFLDGDGRTGSLDLDDSEVSDTTADDDGRYGRAVHAQDAVDLTLTGCTFSNQADAAVFALQATSVNLSGLAVDTVDAASIPDEDDETSGDGVVVTSDDGSGASLDPAGFTAVLEDNTIGGVARAGIVLEGITAEANGNTTAGGEFGAIQQGGAIVTGSDTVDLVDTELIFNRLLFDTTTLTEE